MKNMPLPRLLRRPRLLFLCALVLSAAVASGQSHWVSSGPHGKLVYTYTPKGDRIPDFSYAGYEGGGVALPNVPAVRKVTPSGADDTAAIQKAIDEVSQIESHTGVIRGAVELAPGDFHCSKPLVIAASGVVLRGAGDGKGGTTIEMTGSPHQALRISGQFQQTSTGIATTITDAYVPAGAITLHVADASKLHSGDTLLITKPVTSAWVHFMGMDDMHRNGQAEHWVTAARLEVRRRIASINSDKDGANTITLDVPLMDSYDASFFDGGHAEVEKIEVTGQIAQVGVENIRFVAPQRTIALGAPEFGGMSIRDVADSWFRSITFQDTTNGVSVSTTSERITFEQCMIEQHTAVTSSAKPADFAIDGSQILLDRCGGFGDNTFYVVTQDRGQGPVVVLHCHFTGNGHMAPHQRWFTGLLVDSCEVPGGGIDMMNRGEMGSGHGWAIGWAVAWNDTAQSFAMNTPPGSMIWSIGNRGDETDPAFPLFDGGPPRAALQPATIESPGKPVKPESLYLAQLKERLGDQALKNIGY
jgi:hypothetical protein